MKAIQSIRFAKDDKFIATTVRENDGSVNGVYYYKYTHNYHDNTLKIERISEGKEVVKKDVTDTMPTPLFIEIALEMLRLFDKHRND